MPHSFVKAKVQSKVQELLKKYEPHGSSKHVGKTKYFEPQYDVNKIFHRKTLLSKRGESVKNIRGCPSLSSFPCVKSQKKVEILRENSKKSLSPVAFSENRLLKHSNKSIMASYDRLMNSYSVIPHSKPFVFTKERKKVLRIRKTIESITKDPELKLNSKRNYLQRLVRRYERNYLDEVVYDMKNRVYDASLEGKRIFTSTP